MEPTTPPEAPPVSSALPAEGRARAGGIVSEPAAKGSTFARWLLYAVPPVAVTGVAALWVKLYALIVQCSGIAAGRSRCFSTPLRLLNPLAVRKDTASAVAEAAAAAARAAGDLNGRLVWVAGVVFMWVVGIAVVCASIYWIMDLLDSPAARLAGVGVAAVLGLGFGVYAGIRARQFEPLTAILNVRQLFGGPLPKAVPGSPPPLAGMVLSMVGVTRGLTFVAVAFLGVSASATLATRSGTDDVVAADIEGSKRALDYILYAGALVLIAAVFEYRSLFNWMGALAEAKGYGSRPVITGIGDAVTGALGTVYAMSLAGLYIPPLLVLRKRAYAVAQAGAARLAAAENAVRPTPDEWMQAHGLQFSTPRFVSTLLAVFSPLIAQIPLAAVTKLLG